jgi:hypothetical protein
LGNLPATVSPPTPPPSRRAPASGRAPAFRRGLAAGGATLTLLALAAAPARVAGMLRVPGGPGTEVAWGMAGVLRDLAAVVLVVAPALLVLTALVPLAVRPLRSGRWQRAGAPLVAVPFGLALWAFGITAHEFKSERGAYPTIFDLAEGASNASFLQGTLGFLRYDRYWIPAVLFGVAGAVLLASRLHRPRLVPAAVMAWRPWLAGVAIALLSGAAGLRLFAAVTASPRFRFSASVVGDPFRAIMESSLDLLVQRGKIAPRDLVVTAQLPVSRAAEGASLLGWPPRRDAGAAAPCAHHPYARPLDRSAEPPIPDARGEELVRAFERVSELVFPPEDPRVVVWQLALESFRADDLHALNALAPREIDPFVNALYESAARGGEGVVASRSTYQAGVRTAQGLGALTCGLGTLPYNLSIIRDLQPFPLRCLSDVLTDAGFRGSFFYGSDATFDGMSTFLGAHGFAEQVSQTELPADLPTGAWGAVTDLALVDEATRTVAAHLETDASPRLVMLMSLSNHSPYAAPQDLPPEVGARVDHALSTTTNHAIDDDRRRIVTHSYTDLAVERFFRRLDALHMAERSIVVLAADHSTGEGYVWGKATDAPESDDSKARIPFAIVFPPALRERARDRGALEAAIGAAQRALDAAPISQNDIPALTLALLRAHDRVKAMPAEGRWHTLGGQITSPWFRPGQRPGAYVLGINGVSELFVLDRAGDRVGPYEESVFLKTRGDRYVVTPSLVPVTATLASVMRGEPAPCESARVDR